MAIKCLSAALPLVSLAAKAYSRWAKELRKAARQIMHDAVVNGLPAEKKRVFAPKLYLVCRSLLTAGCWAIGTLTLAGLLGWDCGRYQTCQVRRPAPLHCVGV